MKLGEGTPPRLHLGCGAMYKLGWVNIDQLGSHVDLAWDLAEGIPFGDETVDGVFHEHMLEHLPARVGYLLVKECHRVLRPGGVLRVAVPDAGLCLRSYAGTDNPAWAQSQPTPMLAVQSLFYGVGHVAMYDAETLILTLEAAGFREVAEHQYGVSRFQPSPDSEHRRDGTLYVEGLK